MSTTSDQLLSPTGEQYELSAGPWRAIVTEQGATLRSLTRDGTDVVKPFPADSLPASSQGQQLLPWPNRIRDGHYVFDGVDQQLPISEVDRNNAIHGLAGWVPWSLLEHTADSLTQSVRIMARPGWPGTLEAVLTHRLTDEGLDVEVTARNVGTSPLPFGYAAHPYLVLDAPIDEWTVNAPFTGWLEVDDRLLPVAMHPMDDEHTLSADRPLGARRLDTAFTVRGQDRWEITVSHGDRSHTLWGDAALGWAQIYTPGARDALAVEPMTCGPDAFNEGPTHDGVIRLEPGEDVTVHWGIA